MSVSVTVLEIQHIGMFPDLVRRPKLIYTQGANQPFFRKPAFAPTYKVVHQKYYL